ncbi:hypothetical protein J6590_060330 [Homalodisca vitripennis]|nr:hypothetical protein J6590_060330 [Homalodisca vitripennis]
MYVRGFSHIGKNGGQVPRVFLALERISKEQIDIRGTLLLSDPTQDLLEGRQRSPVGHTELANDDLPYYLTKARQLIYLLVCSQPYQRKKGSRIDSDCSETRAADDLEAASAR